MRTITILIFLLVTSLLRAQDTLSLADCVARALQHHIDIKKRMVEVEKQAIRLQTAKLSRLPALVFGSTQRFDFGRTLDRSNTYTDMNSQTSSFSAVMDIPLFTGFRISNTIKQYRLALKASNYDLEATKRDIELQVVSAYYQVLLKKEIMQLAQEQIALSREFESISSILVEYGKVPRTQLLEASASVADNELQAIQAKSNYRLALIELSQLMEWEKPDSLVVRSSVSIDKQLLLPTNPNEVYAIARFTSPEVLSAKTWVESSEQAVKVTASSYYPTLQLQAESVSGYYHLSNSPNLPFGSQLKNNLQNTVYLTLRIPLFDRFATRNAIRAAKRDIDTFILEVESQRKTLYKFIQRLYYDALSAAESYRAGEKAIVSYAEALRNTKEKYAVGKGTVYEYNEAQTKLAQTKSQQLQAKYEWILYCHLLDYLKGNVPKP